MIRISVVAALVFLVVGCGTTNLALTGQPVRPRPPNCDFAVYTAQVPPGQFAEIGMIDVTHGAYGSNVYRDIGDFKKEIAPHVCKAGGDAVVAMANGLGMWIKGTVLKRVAQAPAAPQPAAPAAAGGCQYDTQCKGDRVCQAGACVSPAPTPAPAPAVAPLAPQTVAPAPAPAPAVPQQ